MTGEPKAADFDWVQARIDCMPAKVFPYLRADIEGNISTFNSVVAPSTPWEVTVDGADAFLVSRAASPSTPHAQIRFRQSAQGIDVSSEDGGQLRITITPFLNDAGDVRLRIDGEGEFDRWQVLRRVLEPYLFGGL